MVVEVCVDLSADAVDTVTTVAKGDKVSEAEAMRRLLSYGKFVYEELAKGHRLYVANEVGPSLKRVTFPLA